VLNYIRRLDWTAVMVATIVFMVVRVLAQRLIW